MASSIAAHAAPAHDVGSRRRAPLFLLVIGLAIGRLLWLQWRISHADYQGDFTAYWMAGQALLHGASPYDFHPQGAGGALFYFTGFLYPPLVACLFVPLARLDFYHAKLVWSAGQIVCLLVGLALTARLAWPRDPRAALAVLLAATSVFPPMLVEFERGQIDCLTFVLVAGGAWAWTERRDSTLAAVLLVAAGLFKLPTLLLLLVPLAFRDARFVRATAATLVAAGVLSLVLNGPRLTGQYWLHYLPSVAGLTHGVGVADHLPPAPSPPPGVLPPSQGGPALWPRVVWEGHAYLEKTTFPGRGSFVSSYMSPVPETLRKAASLAGYLIGVVVLVLGARAGRRHPEAQQARLKQVLLAFAMVTVLVCNPFSWLMNYIWLLYALPILLLAAWEWRAPRPVLLGLLAGGLLNFTWLVPHAMGILYKALDQRFCLGALLLYGAGGALLLWRCRKTPSAVVAEGPARPA